jgi:hypothetical protein
VDGYGTIFTNKVAAARFVDALSETSWDAWLRAALDVPTSAALRSNALDVLAAAAMLPQYRLALWRLGDSLETSAWYALPRRYRIPQTRHDATTRARVIEAAKAAAFALLLRRFLTPTQFDALIAPFQNQRAASGPKLVP